MEKAFCRLLSPWFASDFLDLAAPLDQRSPIACLPEKIQTTEPEWQKRLGVIWV